MVYLLSTYLVTDIAGDGDGQGQNFKSLIFTSSSVSLVPAQTGWCTSDDCLRRRGIMTLSGNQPPGLDQSSVRWAQAGNFELPFQQMHWWSRELLLPETNGTINGEWGLTTVGLGEASAQSNTLPEQYVASYTFKDFFLGSLGLATGAISPAGADKPTFFSSLVEHTELVPSHSYGFTAGASYRKSNLPEHPHAPYGYGFPQTSSTAVTS